MSNINFFVEDALGNKVPLPVVDYQWQLNGNSRTTEIVGDNAETMLDNESTDLVKFAIPLGTVVGRLTIQGTLYSMSASDAIGAEFPSIGTFIGTAPTTGSSISGRQLRQLIQRMFLNSQNIATGSGIGSQHPIILTIPHYGEPNVPIRLAGIISDFNSEAKAAEVDQHTYTLIFDVVKVRG